MIEDGRTDKNGACIQQQDLTPRNLDALVASALGHHQCGRLDDARRLYGVVVLADPGHTDALHLLGVLAHQTGHQESAETMIRRAITLNKRVPSFHSNLGIVLKEQNKLSGAVAAHDAALTALIHEAEAVDLQSAFS